MTSTPKESANIVSLKIKNFLSISDVEIRPGKVNQIVGKNNQGKTTVLKALHWAIEGGSDPAIIKNGENSAEVIVELADSTTVRRRISAEGKQTIEVKRDGFKAPSPQAFLEALFDHSSFNPLELLDPKKRSDAILKSIDIRVGRMALAHQLKVSEHELPPLDYDQHGLKVLEQCHKYFFQRRAEANKDVVDKKNRWGAYWADFSPMQPPAIPDLEWVRVSRETCRASIAWEKQYIDDLNRKNKAVVSANEKFDRYTTEVNKIESDIVDLTAAYENKKAVLSARLEAGKKAALIAFEEIPNHVAGDHDPHERIAKETATLHTLDVNEKELELYAANQKQKHMIEAMEREYQAADAFAMMLTTRVNALAGPIKTDLMATAEMPVTGLQYVDGQFLIDGVTVDNLSSSKALRLAIGVARKLAKKNRVICIDGAEMLDQETYEAFREEIEGDDFVYVLTKVGDAFPHKNDKVFEMDKGQVLQ